MVGLYKRNMGQDLPWVEHATHLGHEFHQDRTLEIETRMRRASFIGRCLEVQEAFSFALPNDTLGAVKLYCGDLYGGMLARLDSTAATQLMNCWGITVKDVSTQAGSVASTPASGRTSWPDGSNFTSP